MCYDAAYYARRLKRLEERYGKISYDKAVWEPRYQISAFSKGKLPVLTTEHPFEVQMISWGFVPTFAKDVKDAAIWRNRSVNCRADTLKVKIETKQNSMFKSITNHPCVILLDGFYEPHTMPDETSIPYYISMKDGETFPVAGLVGTWHDFAEPEKIFQGVTLCTTSANELLAWVHNVPKGSDDFRMPAILEPEEIKSWLDTSLPATVRLSLARPYPTNAMEAHTVINFRTKVNKGVSSTLKVLETYNYGLPDLPTQIDGTKM